MSAYKSPAAYAFEMCEANPDLTAAEIRAVVLDAWKAGELPWSASRLDAVLLEIVEHDDEAYAAEQREILAHQIENPSLADIAEVRANFANDATIGPDMIEELTRKAFRAAP